MSDVLELLKETGFEGAVKRTNELRERARKLHIAYQNFKFVPQEAVDKFQEKLKAATLKLTGRPGWDLHHHYSTLMFTSIKEYEHVPPQAALLALRGAQQKGCFDTFEVAHVASTVEYKDPIIFGRVTGCGDRFFIAQWGDDVSIDDLLGDQPC